MPRPRKCCYIAQPPAVAGMRPVGGDSVAPEAVTLRYDEYEAIRLIALQGMTQDQCAKQMGIARTTVTGIYDSARRKQREQHPQHDQACRRALSVRQASVCVVLLHHR